MGRRDSIATFGTGPLHAPGGARDTLRTVTVVLRAKADASDDEVTDHLASLLPSATFISVTRLLSHRLGHRHERRLI